MISSSLKKYGKSPLKSKHKRTRRNSVDVEDRRCGTDCLGPDSDLSLNSVTCCLFGLLLLVPVVFKRSTYDFTMIGSFLIFTSMILLAMCCKQLMEESIIRLKGTPVQQGPNWYHGTLGWHRLRMMASCPLSTCVRIRDTKDQYR